MPDFYEEFARPWPVRISKDTQRLKEIAALEARYAGPPEAESFGPPGLVDAYEALAGDPSARLRRLAKHAARTLAPGLTSYLTERAPPPPPPNANLYSPGKMPLDRDPQLEGAVADVANIASNFVGPGGAAKAIGAGSGKGLGWLLAMAIPPGRRGAGRGGAGGGGKLPMDEPSRFARADEMGYRRNAPLYGSSAPEGEQIAAAAIMVDDRVFTGRTHYEAAEHAAKVLGTSIDDLLPRLAPIPDGFVTTGGRYVSRHEAADIAKAADQSRKPIGENVRRWPEVLGLASERLQQARSSSGHAGDVRIGATASGLPGGGGGVWLLMEPTKPGKSTLQWHRTARPGEADVQGLTLPEIHATLDDAWSRGYDAVTLRNYTVPDGRLQNVMVVRDANQLRVPEAVFDPSKKLSRDLTAGILPPIAIGGAAAAGNDFADVFGGRRKQ